jgi:hypothetical protein
MEGDRFEPQHRRQQHLETPRAQCGGGGLIVGLRTGDENSHASNFRHRESCSNGRLAFATSQCYRGYGKPAFDDNARAQIG